MSHCYFGSGKALLLCMFMLLNSHVYGQFNYAGKEFYISLGGSLSEPAYFFSGKILLASKHMASVKLEYTNPGLTFYYNVKADSVVVVSVTPALAQALSNTSFEQVSNKSLRITSDSTITVTIVSDRVVTEDATHILPVDNQYKIDKYQLLGMTTNMVAGVSAYPMVATCDSVVLEIIPSDTTYNHVKGIPFVVKLNKGETYQLGTHNHGINVSNDLAATQINILSSPVNFPLYVFCSHPALYDERTGYSGIIQPCCADYPFEELMPVNWWDTLMPIIPYDSILGYKIRVLSSANNNPLYINNVFIKNLNVGDIFDTTINSEAIISAAKPIGVAKLMLSYVSPYSAYPGGGDGDPDILWCMSFRQGIRDGYFKVVIPSYGQPAVIDNSPLARLNIISEASNINSIRLNGTSVSQFFKIFPSNNNWMYARIPIDSMDTVVTYHLTSDAKIIASVNRQYIHGGWGYNISDTYVNMLDSSIAYVYDTIYKCKGKSATLHAEGVMRGKWSTGDAVSSITVTDAGAYIVNEVYYYACSEHPVVHRFDVIDTQVLIREGVQQDTILKCEGHTVSLSGNASIAYLWNTNDTTQSITIQDTGSYYVHEIKKMANCGYNYIMHHFNVSNFTIDIIPNLAADTPLCIGETLMLRTGIATTTWSTGIKGMSITVKDTGLYTASVIDTCGNAHIDSIYVYADECSDRYCNIVFPDAFTPNGDGKNDVFRAIKRGLFNDYHLLVYDRWGRCVFETYDVNGGWDGTYHGETSPLDTYMYLCTVDCPAKGSIVFKGDVTLIR